MIIGTNSSAVNGNRFLSKAQFNQSKWMEQLSSGKRINRAGDDAAGTAVSSRLDKLIRGNKVAMRNAGDGISMVQTAEGAMSSLESILQRMRELAVQSANGTYEDATDRVNLEAEYDQLEEEFAKIIDTTKFNGVGLMDGITTTIDLQVGALDTDVMTLNMTDATALSSYVAGTNTIATQADATSAIAALDGDLDALNTARATMGAYQNRLEYTIDNLNTNVTNTTSAKSRILDADMAEASSELAKYRVLSQSSIAMIAQANQAPQMVQQLLG